MTGLVLLLALVLVLWAGVRARRAWLARRRRQLLAKPFPPAWRAILEKNSPLYRRLPENVKDQLHGIAQVLLAEKNFEGAGGLAMTDEIRVTIAGQAAVLLLNRETDYFGRLRSVVVYPTEFEVDQPFFFSGGHHTEDTEVRAGESWHAGAVVLAWDDVLSPREGRNVVLHEFAHQLDEENATADGVPALPRFSDDLAWREAVGREYRSFRRRVRTGAADVMDDYGAKNEAEFFAVATEYFFEQPLPFSRQHPSLYERLRMFYQQDPIRYATSG